MEIFRPFRWILFVAVTVNTANGYGNSAGRYRIKFSEIFGGHEGSISSEESWQILVDGEPHNKSPGILIRLDKTRRHGLALHISGTYPEKVKRREIRIISKNKSAAVVFRGKDKAIGVGEIPNFGLLESVSVRVKGTAKYIQDRISLGIRIADKPVTDIRIGQCNFDGWRTLASHKRGNRLSDLPYYVFSILQTDSNDKQSAWIEYFSISKPEGSTEDKIDLIFNEIEVWYEPAVVEKERIIEMANLADHRFVVKTGEIARLLGTCKVASGVRIQVEGILVADGCVFRGENGAWGGIEFMGRGRGFIKNCTFMDVLEPILARKKYLECDETKFPVVISDSTLIGSKGEKRAVQIKELKK